MSGKVAVGRLPPAMRKTPMWVGTWQGQPQWFSGLYSTKAEAVMEAEIAYCDPHPTVGVVSATRVWVAVEKEKR